MKQKAFIEKVASKIDELGLKTPAILMLEAHKPLSYISSHLLLIAQPTLDILFPKKFTQNTVDLLADPTQLEQLIISLEKTHSKNLASIDPQSNTTAVTTSHLQPRHLPTNEIEL